MSARTIKKLPGTVPFEMQSISTMSSQVYMNATLNIRGIFDMFVPDVRDVSYRFSKKKRDVNKQTIKAPDEQIFSTRFEDQYKGVDMRKIKRKNSNKTYFRNQVMFDFNLDGCRINIMMFKNNFKITGSKTDDQNRRICNIVFGIFKDSVDLWELLPGHDVMEMLIDGTMKNTLFRGLYPVDRKVLNILMNDDRYSDTVISSEYETVHQPSVKIKIRADRPEDHIYEVVRFDGDSYTVHNVPENVYNKKVSNPTTIIVFASGEVTLSGKYTACRKMAYDFINMVFRVHRDELEEKGPEETKMIDFDDLMKNLK
jgi:hypothetical protein